VSSAAAKVVLLERLASDPGAAPGERENARRAAARLRLRAPANDAPPYAPPRPPPRASRVERRGGVDCWVGDPPTHGPICAQGFGGCGDCLAIEAWRRWLRGQPA
jgi:hypothetical protein